MNTPTTLGHILCSYTYHPVIAPKIQWEKILFGSARKEIGEILRQLAKQKGIEIIKGNTLPDHIHMVVSTPPKYRVFHVVALLKVKSTIFMQHGERLYLKWRPLSSPTPKPLPVVFYLALEHSKNTAIDRML